MQKQSISKMSITIRSYLVTFLTRKNVRELIDEVFANYTKNNVLHGVFSNSLFLLSHVSFCDALRYCLLRPTFDNYHDVSFEAEYFEYFEHLIMHPTFIKHIASVQQINPDTRYDITFQQRLKWNQMDALFDNIYYVDICTTTFNDAVDFDIIPDYICIKEITIFIKFVLNNFDRIGRNVLSRCVNDDFFADSTKTSKTFYEHVRYTLEQIFIEHPDGEIVRRLCNTIPYTDFAEQWHIKRRCQFAFFCETVYTQYELEQNKMVCRVLCDEYVMRFICKFL